MKPNPPSESKDSELVQEKEIENLVEKDLKWGQNAFSEIESLLVDTKKFDGIIDALLKENKLELMGPLTLEDLNQYYLVFCEKLNILKLKLFKVESSFKELEKQTRGKPQKSDSKEAIKCLLKETRNYLVMPIDKAKRNMICANKQ